MSYASGPNGDCHTLLARALGASEGIARACHAPHADPHAESALLRVLLPDELLGAGNAALQRWTPLRLQGRVAAAADTLVSTPQTLSIALGAALSTVVNYRVLVIAIAVGVAVTSLYLFSRPIPSPGRADEGSEPGGRMAALLTESMALS